MLTSAQEAMPAEQRQKDRRRAVDHYTDQARLAQLEQALRELVTCKDLKDDAERRCLPANTTQWLDYHRRKPLAWEAARAALKVSA